MPGFPIHATFDEERTRPCIINEGFENAGMKGDYFGRVKVGDRYWAFVQMRGEDDPSLHKVGAISLLTEEWTELSTLIVSKVV